MLFETAIEEHENGLYNLVLALLSGRHKCVAWHRQVTVEQFLMMFYSSDEKAYFSTRKKISSFRIYRVFILIFYNMKSLFTI